VTSGEYGAIVGDTQLQSCVLEDLSDAVNYRRWLADLARPYLGDNPLEVGSGLGLYIEEWLDTVPRFTGTEADDDRLAHLTARFQGNPRVAVRRLLLPTEERGEHSAVVALNVLEHISDDVGALKSIADLIRPDGAIVIVVPAFQSAMSKFDLAIGHQRRYTVASMTETVAAAGLRLERVQYVNPIGLFGWYIVCRMLRMRPRNGAMLRGYDRLIVPWLRRAEQGRRMPFGQSVLAVIRKQ
jgi:SAM-dependent methyltransferase